tara:strand:- start:360662 stop:362476 length:1815 start_codon:yes stop_codon:yes gene_type:complete
MYKNELKLNITIAQTKDWLRQFCVQILTLFMCGALLLAFTDTNAHAQEQVFSSAHVRITGIVPNSTPSIDIENSGQRHTAKATKKGTALISGQFPENLEIGISSGINYTLKYDVPYRDLKNNRKTLDNSITFSFSALSGDVIFLGRTSDTGLIEYSTGSSEMKSVTAATSGVFRGGALKNADYSTNSQGSMFLIVTNTAPETGDPLPPVYIEAHFALAKQTHKKRDKAGFQSLYASAANGLFKFPDSKIRDAWGKGLYSMASEFSTNMLAQAGAVGAILDGYVGSVTQREMQVLQAQSTQRYKPSVSVCKFPSVGKSISRASYAARAQSQIFAKYMQDYDMKHSDSAGAMISNHRSADYIQKFRTRYCNAQQNGTDGLKNFCTGTGADKQHVNHDINFPYFFSTLQGNKVNLIDAQDLTDATSNDNQSLSDGEVDLFLLTHNLFDSNIRQYPESIIKTTEGERAITDLRSLQAIRNVAKNSFATLVGNRASGSSLGNNEQILKVLETLGASNVPENYGLSDKGGVSYDAIMEALTKKLYQDPAFYANLYDSPENVARQKAAIKAIQLMQGWDVVKALHRREMLLSMLVEVKLRKKQRRIEVNMD